MGWLRAQRPDLLERYEDLYRHGAYMPAQERKRLVRLVHRAGAPDRRWRMRGPSTHKRDAEEGTTPSKASNAIAAQESLF